jgi:hypothetical protein
MRSRTICSGRRGASWPFQPDDPRARGHGGVHQPEATQHLGDVLIQRRDRIGAAYLIGVSPLVEFSLSLDGRLSFVNAAVQAGVAPEPKGGYRVTWARFDNSTNSTTAFGDSAVADSRTPATPPQPLPDATGTFVCVRVSPITPPYDTWGGVRAYFRRTAGSWVLVGLDRSGQVNPVTLMQPVTTVVPITSLTRLGTSGLRVSRIGLGLASLGRPAYMTWGRDADLGADRSIRAMRCRCYALLDAARAAGVRYVDTARSYGLAEQFLSAWCDDRRLPAGALTVGRNGATSTPDPGSVTRASTK